MLFALTGLGIAVVNDDPILQHPWLLAFRTLSAAVSYVFLGGFAWTQGRRLRQPARLVRRRRRAGLRADEPAVAALDAAGQAGGVAAPGVRTRAA